MTGTRKAFTLVELMVVILIVGILAAAAIPLMRGRIDAAKWLEANATAGTIRAAVRVYFAETGDTTTIVGELSDADIQSNLGFTDDDLTGTYFVAGDYEITQVSGTGVAEVTVTGSQDNAPDGSKTLALDGTWQ
jgi:type IV pilus assembly protein PilA